MKKIIFPLLASLLLNPFFLFATEKLEIQQVYYRPYYKNYGTGKNVTVAIIDEGVWQGHPDLQGSEWLNKKEISGNGLDDDKNGYIDDYYGWNFIENSFDITPKGTHGTAVAGIIGAQINQLGIAGIAPDVKIMSLVACGTSGCPFESVKNAILYAVNNGANIINLSLGGAGYVGYNESYDELMEYAYQKGVVVIVAAGNGDPEAPGIYGQDLDQLRVSPVCNDKDGINMVIGVGATNRGDREKAKWSNFGSCVDAWAQGVDVTTTTDPKHNGLKFYDETKDGTSFAAPIITGIVAVLKSAYPELTNLELIDMISSSPDPYNLNEIIKIMDWSQCRLTSFNTAINNGDSVLIFGQHFHSNSSFSLIYIDSNGNQTKTNIDRGIRILDADKISLDTSILQLEPGIYSLKETNNKCGDNWNSLEIKGLPSGSNNQASITTGESGKSFSDADYLSNNLIIHKQNTNSAYRLLDKVLRQEVIGMAVKLGALSLPDDYSCNGKFSDVSQTKPNNWICRAVEIAANRGIVSVLNSKFRPEESITRVEALSILMKAAGIQIQEFNGISKYSDVNLAWQINVVNTALTKGFIDGTEDFYPNRQATREEIFNMARRILESQ